jgi:acyl carrier protein
VSHAELARTLQQLHAELAARGAGSAGGSSWLCTRPPATAAGLTDVLAALTSGATAVLTAAPPAEAVTETALLIAEARVTHLRTTPLLAERLLDASPRPLTVVLGGDAHAAPTVLAGLRTRATVVETVEADGRFGPVAFDGLPPRGLRLQVVDTRQRPVPVGVVGEVYVAGSDGPPQPTGRLARVARDGRLEAMGPLGPHRTRELLDLHPAVRDSRVVERPDPARAGRRLVGYVRLVAGEEFAPDAIRRALAERRLPRPLIPDVLVAVDDWPLAADGTVDPDRLPEPPGDTEPADGPAAKPWDDRFEALLRDVLAGTAHDGDLAPDVPLADAGLSSMATVGLIVAIEQLYDIVIPDDFQVVDMFRTPRDLWQQICEFRAAEL